MEKVKFIWVDGELSPWEETRVHFFTHTFHYGLGVFEGVRAYEGADGRTGIFRLREHVRRLYDSARMCRVQIPLPMEQVIEGCREVVRANGLRECYLRPLAWLGEGSMGIGSTSNPVHVGVGAFAWGAYLGAEAAEKGIRCCVSSLTRLSNVSHLTKAKVCGQYVNSILAKRAANLSGYDEAILLTTEGHVAEGSGENIFRVRDGVITTPPTSAPILPGITRDAILTLARELGLEAREQLFHREDLYVADELFFTGTAAEVTPIREVDGRVIGEGRRGPITQRLQEAFQDVVRGRSETHADWRTLV